MVGTHLGPSDPAASHQSLGALLSYDSFLALSILSYDIYVARFTPKPQRNVNLTVLPYMVMTRPCFSVRIATMGGVTIAVTAQAATDHCPNCLGVMRTENSKRLKDGIRRSYRTCGAGCGYRDRAVLIIEAEIACGA